jgi:hypothetical protein
MRDHLAGCEVDWPYPMFHRSMFVYVVLELVAVQAVQAAIARLKPFFQAARQPDGR